MKLRWTKPLRGRAIMIVPYFLHQKGKRFGNAANRAGKNGMTPYSPKKSCITSQNQEPQNDNTPDALKF